MQVREQLISELKLKQYKKTPFKVSIGKVENYEGKKCRRICVFLDKGKMVLDNKKMVFCENIYLPINKLKYLDDMIFDLANMITEAVLYDIIKNDK